jgi:hypothetical protein
MVISCSSSIIIPACPRYAVTKAGIQRTQGKDHSRNFINRPQEKQR